MDKDQAFWCVPLWVEEPVLGTSRLVQEGGVWFGRPTVSLVPDDALPAWAQHRVDLGKWRFTHFDLPFDLADLPGHRRYVEVKIAVTFDDPEVRSATLAVVAGADDGDGCEASTWGVGRHELAWKLVPREERSGIRPGGRRVTAMIESPLVSDVVTGTLDATARVSRQWLGTASVAAAAPRHPTRFTLGVVSGDFECTAPA